jgi:hypothetical protein
MSDDPIEQPASPSRRLLMHSAMSAIGAAALIGIRSESAVAIMKISQKAVAYQDHPQGDKRCDKCVQFLPPNACKMVDGAISAQGSCRIFMPKQQAAEQSAAMPSAG